MHLIDSQREAIKLEELSKEQQDSLTERLKAGNRAAAGELVDIYYSQIYLYMRRLGHSRQISEDLTQESFLQAWRHIGQLRSGKSLKSWLYRIASNSSKLYWRRGSGRKDAGLEETDAVDGGESAGEAAGRLENTIVLKHIIDGLPSKLRQAVVLHYMQQLSISEGAKAIGVANGTFKSRLSRALKAIRKQIISENGELL